MSTIESHGNRFTVGDHRRIHQHMPPVRKRRSPRRGRVRLIQLYHATSDVCFTVWIDTCPKNATESPYEEQGRVPGSNSAHPCTGISTHMKQRLVGLHHQTVGMLRVWCECSATSCSITTNGRESVFVTRPKRVNVFYTNPGTLKYVNRLST